MVNQMSDHQTQAFTKGRLTNSPSAIRNLLSHSSRLTRWRALDAFDSKVLFDKPSRGSNRLVLIVNSRLNVIRLQPTVQPGRYRKGKIFPPSRYSSNSEFIEVAFSGLLTAQ
jgi:hypothetical protein